MIIVKDKTYVVHSKQLTREDLGGTVLVYTDPGQPPIEAAISKIDFLSNIILEVFVGDAKTKENIIRTKDKVVLLVKDVIETKNAVSNVVKRNKGLFKSVIRFFKKLFG